MGLAWGWHGVGMGLAWGWHGVSMGLAWAAWGRMGINLQDPRRKQSKVPPATHTPPPPPHRGPAAASRMSHVSCNHMHGLWFGNFVRSALRCDVRRRGLLASRHPPCRSAEAEAARVSCIHNWTSREPVSAAGEEDMSVHPLNKGLMAQACL
jgi:hypothetical protein